MKRWSLAVPVLFVLSLVPRPAAAQAVCNLVDFTFLPPDGRLFTFTAAGTTNYGFMGATNIASGGLPRSYSIEVNGLNGGFSAAPALYVRADATCFTSSTLSGLSDTTRIEPRVACESPECPDSNHRFSFTTSAVFVSFMVSNPSATARPYTISLAETTMFSPAWSTNGTYATYYSLFNNTSKVITAVLTLRSSGGTLGGQATLSIPPFTTMGTNTTALSTPPNLTGTASITHNGPPGALTVGAAIANFSSTPAFIQPVAFEAPRQVR